MFWPRLRRAALAEMSRDEKAAALARVAGEPGDRGRVGGRADPLAGRGHPRVAGPAARHARCPVGGLGAGRGAAGGERVLRRRAGGDAELRADRGHQAGTAGVDVGALAARTFAALAAGEIDEPRAAALAEALSTRAGAGAGQVEARLLPTADRAVGGPAAGAGGGAAGGAGPRGHRWPPRGRRARRRRAGPPRPRRGDGHPGYGHADGRRGGLPGPGRPAGPDAEGRRRPPPDRAAPRRGASPMLRPAARPPGAARRSSRSSPCRPCAALTGPATAPVRWTVSRSPPPTCASCSPSWTRSGCAPPRRVAGVWRSPTPTAPCAPPSPRAELRRLARRGCRAHPAGDCDCPLLDLPPPADRYHPTAAQRRFVSTRDRTCRHPRCRDRSAGRPRPRHPARPRRRHRLHQPVLPVPQPPPAQDLRPRLALRPGPRRHPARHHPRRRHPRLPPHPAARQPPLPPPAEPDDPPPF